MKIREKQEYKQIHFIFLNQCTIYSSLTLSLSRIEINVIMFVAIIL